MFVSSDKRVVKKVVKNGGFKVRWKQLPIVAKVLIILGAIFFALPVAIFVIMFIFFFILALFGVRSGRQQVLNGQQDNSGLQPKMSISIYEPLAIDKTAIDTKNPTSTSLADTAEKVYFGYKVDSDDFGGKVFMKVECEGFAPKTPQSSSCGRSEDEFEKFDNGTYIVIDRSEFSGERIKFKVYASFDENNFDATNSGLVVREVDVDNIKYIKSQEAKARGEWNALTFEKFEKQIHEGMTKEQIKSVFDFDNRCRISTQSGLYEIYSCDGSESFSVVSLMFENGVLTMKSQSGLR